MEVGQIKVEPAKTSYSKVKENGFSHVWTFGQSGASRNWYEFNKVVSPPFIENGHEWKITLGWISNIVANANSGPGSRGGGPVRKSFQYIDITLNKLKPGCSNIKGRYSILLRNKNNAIVRSFQFNAFWKDFNCGDHIFHDWPANQADYIHMLCYDIIIPHKVEFVFWELEKLCTPNIFRELTTFDSSDSDPSPWNKSPNSSQTASNSYNKPTFTVPRLEEFTDFTILAEGKSIKVNKFVLAGHSEVFFAMLKSGMKENSENCMRIDDFPLDIVELMVEYMYSGRLENWPEDLNKMFDLIRIADKYQITGLKTRSENKVFAALNLENCVQIAELAKNTNSIELLDSIYTEFIRNQMVDMKVRQNVYYLTRMEKVFQILWEVKRDAVFEFELNNIRRLLNDLTQVL